MPKYVELVNWIKEQIKQGKLQPGEKLYSENDLTQMFGISRQTVRHAIGILEKEGEIDRIKGSGTYISERKRERKRTKRVALIATYTDGYIFPMLIQKIQSALFKEGYSVMVSFTDNEHMKERSILKEIIERDEVSGIICEPIKTALPNPNIDLYKVLRKNGIPILFINSYYAELDIPHVSMNDVEAARILTEYLISQGHRDILAIFKLEDVQGHRRYAGYCQALYQHRITNQARRIVWIDNEEEKELELSMDKILKRAQGCSAILCHNDEIAFNLIKLLKKKKIRIPEDISIVGMDDTELATLGDVQLTTVPLQMDLLGKVAAKNLLQMIEDSDFDGNYESDVFLEIRSSVKRMD